MRFDTITIFSKISKGYLSADVDMSQWTTSNFQTCPPAG